MAKMRMKQGTKRETRQAAKGRRAAQPEPGLLAAQLTKIAREFHGRGWALGTSGNYSAVLNANPLRLLITSSGLDKSVLTERDFLAKVAGRPDFASLPVRDFMTVSPETVAPTDTLAFAVGKMDAGGYRHLPVAEKCW